MVRPGFHGGYRQPAAKVKVGAVGFVRQAQHPGVMRHLDDGPQVAADAVVGGVVHQHGHGVGVLGNGLGHLLPLHAQGDAQPGIHLRVDVDRHRTAQHQSVQHAAVDVAGQNDLVAPLAGGKHHALHRAGGAAHHQKGVCCAKGVGGQLLGLPDHRYRVAEVVQGLHAVYVHTHALLTQKSGQLRVAPAALVARHIKRHHPHLTEALQRFVDGGPPLIQPGMFCVPVHCVLPKFCFVGAFSGKRKTQGRTKGLGADLRSKNTHRATQ